MTMTDLEMSKEVAVRQLDLSRQIRWAFPTSMGRPVGWDVPESSVQHMIQLKPGFVDAAGFFVHVNALREATELAANSWRLWVLSRDDENGQQFLNKVLDTELQDSSRFRSLALYGDSLMAFRRGRLEESKRRSLDALKAAEHVRDPEALGLANLALSRVSFETEDYELAKVQAINARNILAQLPFPYGQAPLFMHAESERMLRDYERASTLFEQSLALNRQLEDRGMVIAELTNLGRVEIHRGNVATAEKCFDEAEQLAGTPNQFDMAMDFLNKATLATLKGDNATAASFLEKCETTMKDSKIELGPDDKFDLDWTRQRIIEAKRHQTSS